MPKLDVSRFILKPVTIYNNGDALDIVTSDMIRIFHGEKLAQRFHQWMNGQTTMTHNSVTGYYYHDYIRWTNCLPIID